MGFSRQEYWSRLPSPSPGIFLTQGLNPHLSYLPHWLVGSLPRVLLESPGLGLDSFNLVFLKFIYFNWKIITLQYCIGFCHTVTWINHRYICIPSLLNLPLSTHFLQVVTEHQSELPESYSKFSLAIYFANLEFCKGKKTEGNGIPLQYSCLENPMGGGGGSCSPRGLEESDTTEWLHFHFSLSCTGEGNGNPFQCSCLENPRNGGAWWAAVYGVAQSRTRLKWLSSSSSSKGKKKITEDFNDLKFLCWNLSSQNFRT